MAKKKTTIPQYGTVMRKGVQYYRTRILDADGKKVSLYATTCEELYEKQAEAKRQVEEIIFHREHPTVAEYCEKWLLMQSAKVSAATLKGYTSNMNNYIIKPMGDMYMEEVTADDIRLALVPLSKKSAGLYNTVNMLIKCIFYSAERSQLLQHNPCVGISSKGGKPIQKKEALTDQQVKVLLDTVKGLPPQLFVMIGLYSGLRREEALALQWDCVFLDAPTPYISVRRAWRTEHNRPVISTTLKTKAARRDIPIPKCLADYLREVKETSASEYVISDSNGEPLSASQFQRVWQYVVVRSTQARNYYKYVNGQSIKYTVTPALGMTQKNNPKIQYTLDFHVTPHLLRHTYITNLLYSGVDPKTVQYLAGHENSKTTMDIYAKVKYNKPEELFAVVNGALFHELHPEITAFDYSWSIVNDPKKTEAVKSGLKNIVASYNNIALDEINTAIEYEKMSNTLAFGSMEVLSWMVFLFGVINLINTTLSNQIARKRENSILRSIGLIQKQLCKMNICEGLCYALFATLATLIVGFPASIFACRKMSIGAFAGKVVPYKFPVLEMGLFILVLFGMELILSVWTIRRQKKQSLIEQMRAME